MTILDAFDDTSEEVIRASQWLDPIPGFPETRQASRRALMAS